MTESSNGYPQIEAPQTQEPELTPQELRQQRLMVVGAVAFLLLLVGLLIGGIFLAIDNPETTTVFRDVMIILLALEFAVIGLALVILLIQLARLINLLQNEIQPILESTNETANTLRGTATFLSENMVEPVVKLNEYLAVVRRMLDLLNIGR
ncbi:MAG: hypothetical protein DWQ07_02925 [Chloroflexi bacterium]|nr:MAG: hypothetical protein DWQ07_02925 [Chloroflexota bacterium]MBL1193546.1 hypothetical protein [Chloroflexota bacterium]NOH10837.1 hypothetical protein [Chloroflexota bacterium]